MSDFFCFSIPFFLHILWMNATLISNFMVDLLHRINPYCTVFGSHLLHRMHPYYTVIGSHLLHIINPWLHWFWFNFTLYYLYLASDYTISDYTVFQKYSIQCIPGSCCKRIFKHKRENKRNMKFKRRNKLDRWIGPLSTYLMNLTWRKILWSDIWLKHQKFS